MVDYKMVTLTVRSYNHTNNPPPISFDPSLKVDFIDTFVDGLDAVKGYSHFTIVIA